MIILKYKGVVQVQLSHYGTLVFIRSDGYREFKHRLHNPKVEVVGVKSRNYRIKYKE